MIAPMNYRLCALLLGGWLFDNRCSHVVDIHQRFSLTLRAKQWQIRQDRVLPQPDPGFTVADRA